jgi:hypothetical protein
MPVLQDEGMTRLLEEAMARAGALSVEQQDSLARLILEEIESDKRWEELFAKSPEKLAALADDAWAEHEAGKTELLDPDKL